MSAACRPSLAVAGADVDPPAPVAAATGFVPDSGELVPQIAGFVA